MSRDRKLALAAVVVMTTICLWISRYYPQLAHAMGLT